MPTHFPHNAYRPGEDARPSPRPGAPVRWIAASVGAVLIVYGLAAWTPIVVAVGVVGCVLSRSAVASRHYLLWSSVAYVMTAVLGG